MTSRPSCHCDIDRSMLYVSVTEEGDDLTECLNDESLLLINHQATGDIPTIMSLTASKGVAVNGNTMWIMDLLFKWTNFGMVSQVHGDFFILQVRCLLRYGVCATLFK